MSSHRSHSIASWSPPRHPCPETFRIGQFVFHCTGHDYSRADLIHIARRTGDPLIKHTHAVDPCPGQVEVSWWTEVPTELDLAPFLEQ